MTRRMLLLFFISGLAFLTPAHTTAQISGYSLFASEGHAPLSCKEAVSVFAAIAAAYPHPVTKWRFIVACDDPSFERLMRHIGITGRLDAIYGETDIEDHITILRGAKLLHPDQYFSPDRIIAHELAHILLRSADEKLVDQTARDWIVDRQRSPGPGTALIASR